MSSVGSDGFHSPHSHGSPTPSHVDPALLQPLQLCNLINPADSSPLYISYHFFFTAFGSQTPKQTDCPLID